VDFREELVAARATELANELGNLVNRTIALAGERELDGARPRVPDVDAPLAAYDIRGAADAVWSLVATANRFVSQSRPWELTGQERDDAVGYLLAVCEVVAREIEPFLPAAAGRITQALATRDRNLGRALFRKPG
jgi:methionyl-tRNA synthetase